VLNLASKTKPEWLERSLEHIDDVLIDHAHCEKKAAGAALRLLFRYPQHDFLQLPLSEIAREELSHFELVLEELRVRGVALGRQKPSPYGGKLHQLFRPRDPDQLVDHLLISALIEARSCERFQLLAGALEDKRLAAFYETLLVSEARHHRLYVELAEQLAPSSEVRARLQALAESEAEILASETSPLARLHT